MLTLDRSSKGASTERAAAAQHRRAADVLHGRAQHQGNRG